MLLTGLYVRLELSYTRIYQLILIIFYENIGVLDLFCLIKIYTLFTSFHVLYSDKNEAKLT